MNTWIILNVVSLLSHCSLFIKVGACRKILWKEKKRIVATPEGTSHLKQLGYVHNARKSDLNLIYFYLFILCCMWFIINDSLNVSVFIKFDTGHLHVRHWTRYTANDFESHLSLTGHVTWPNVTWLIRVVQINPNIDVIDIILRQFKSCNAAIFRSDKVLWMGSKTSFSYTMEVASTFYVNLFTGQNSLKGYVVVKKNNSQVDEWMIDRSSHPTIITSTPHFARCCLLHGNMILSHVGFTGTKQSTHRW